MPNHERVPIICIVGRPNVGKSSLFNKLLGARRAVVLEQSGTTRDRVEALVPFGDVNLKLVDTGGYVAEEKDHLSLKVKEQIHLAMKEASMLLFVTDVIAGITPADREVSILLRKYSKPVMVVANKADNQKLADDAVEFYQLGFGDPMPVSCSQNLGIRPLKARIRSLFKLDVMAITDGRSDKSIRVAIVGRPNVGKSSLVNAILEEERVIVSDVPGTTRDTVDTVFTLEGADYVLVDTAGIRHRRKVKTVVDSFSMMRSKDAIERADIVLLILDAVEGVTSDDVGILRLIEENGKGCAILVNKWDLAREVEGVTKEEYEKHLVYASSLMNKFPVIFVSARTRENMKGIFSLVKTIDVSLDTKAPTPLLNKLFEKRTPSGLPVPKKRKRPNFLYITQKSSRPMVFMYFVNDPKLVLPGHISFIENTLRDNLPLRGVPVRIELRGKKESKK
ncbi:MAG: ribosome biogenesis GTPase Der [Candidatus Omnitrophica bacterium]|nr:ribosome biogenesis GTPase Der [Candidatus Omnitrophota bacterium]MDD4012964.1 ribosome biogenesis GTPase Der [Candidatus Omnitrophota bacterium]